MALTKKKKLTKNEKQKPIHNKIEICDSQLYPIALIVTETAIYS